MLSLLISGLLFAKTPLGLPSYTAANPNGFWGKLPRGRNYVFCGDRIFFSENFDTKVKVVYEKDSKVADFRKHCLNRKRHIEKTSKNAEPGEAPLIVSSFRHLNSKIEKVIKNKKHARYIDAKGLHYKELIKAFGEAEVNRLRSANLLLPYMTFAEFQQAYAKSTNNPAYLKAEYSRYSSNLLTQNPAMLYTKDGKLYYFSFNLSDEQMRRLAGLVGGAGGGSLGGGGGYGSNSPLAKGGAKGSAGEDSRMPASASAGPGVGLEAGFPGFTTDSEALRVAPQPTRLPSSMGVSPASTLRVPKYDQIAGRIRPSSSANNVRQMASAGGGGPRIVNPSDFDGAMGAFDKLKGKDSGSGRERPDRIGRSKPSSSNDSSPTSPSASSGLSEEISEVSVIGKRKEPEDIFSSKSNLDSNSTAIGDQMLSLVRKDTQSQGLRLPTKEKTSKTNYTCDTKQWHDIARGIDNDSFLGTILKESSISEQTKENFKCTLLNKSQFCGFYFYDRSCLPGGERNCATVMNNDIDNICKKYLRFERDNSNANINGTRSRKVGIRSISNDEPLSYTERLECSQVMMAIACKEIPCKTSFGDVYNGKVEFYDGARNQKLKKGLEQDIAEKNEGIRDNIDISFQIVRELSKKSDILFDLNYEEQTSNRIKKVKLTEETKDLQSLLKLRHIKYTSHNMKFSHTGDDIDLKKYLENSPWQPTEIESFRTDLTKLKVYYDLNASSEEGYCSIFSSGKNGAQGEN
tara:strand:- start:3653 stop:5887 length:2235 start_codon:yes stop_codon:yes gene_type:complete